MPKRANPIPENYVGLSKGDEVVLSSRYPHHSTSASPIWGGRLGFVVGVVDKVKAGSHNKQDHRVCIRWPTTVGTSELRNTDLELASMDHGAIAERWDQDKSVLPNTGVYILVRSKGEFYLGYMDYNMTPTPTEPYHIMFTQQPMPSLDDEDYNILSIWLSAEDFMSVSQPSPNQALEVFCRENGFEKHPALTLIDPTNIPKFSSIREAVATIPIGESRDGVLLFTTAMHVYDVADQGPAIDLPSVKGLYRAPDHVDSQLAENSYAQHI